MENRYIDTYDPIGQITLQQVGGSKYVLGVSAGNAGYFLIWSDNDNLEIWRDDDGTSERTDFRLGGVRVIFKSYEFPHNDRNIYNRPGLDTQTVIVNYDEVVGSFSGTEEGALKKCVLKIGTVRDKEYNAASMEITALVSSNSGSVHPTASVSTRFELRNDHEATYRTTLTSATMSDIPSYNRIPVGSEGDAVRGQFLEQNAVSLISELENSNVVLDFSHNFFSYVVKYKLPLQAVRNEIDRFKGCLGDADML